MKPLALLVALSLPVLGSAQTPAAPPASAPATAAASAPPAASGPGAEGNFMFKTHHPGHPVDGRANVFTGPVPPDLPYDQLSPAQKAAVRALQADLAPENDPPYPLGGQRDLLEPLAQAQLRIVSTGLLVMDILVSADGVVEGVKPVKSPDNDMRRFAHRLALRTKFKPALYAGQPCRGTYRLMMQFM